MVRDLGSGEGEEKDRRSGAVEEGKQSGVKLSLDSFREETKRYPRLQDKEPDPPRRGRVHKRYQQYLHTPRSLRGMKNIARGKEREHVDKAVEKTRGVSYCENNAMKIMS